MSLRQPPVKPHVPSAYRSHQVPDWNGIAEGAPSDTLAVTSGNSQAFLNARVSRLYASAAAFWASQASCLCLCLCLCSLQAMKSVGSARGERRAEC